MRKEGKRRGLLCVILCDLLSLRQKITANIYLPTIIVSHNNPNPVTRFLVVRRSRL